MEWYIWKEGKFAYAPNCLVRGMTPDEPTVQAVSMDDDYGHWVHIANGLYVLDK